MSTTHQLSASSRSITGRKVKSLRRQGIIPANLFGPERTSLSIQVPITTFLKLYQEAGETSVVDLTPEGESKSVPVLIHQIQRHPVTGDILHVDFMEVDLKKKVSTTVPLEITGVSLAVKDLGGVLNQAMTEIEIEALPTDIPEMLTIDISRLAEIGQSLTVKDITIPAKVTLLTDPETVLVTIQAAQEEEIVEEEVVEVEEPESSTSPSEDESKQDDQEADKKE
jgi:large subunit ribosomal protein L25